MIFYIFSILFIGLLLPANLPEFSSSDRLASSPFVIALQGAGIPGMVAFSLHPLISWLQDHFMNFICFIAVLSAANSAIYASSRSLMAMAREGKAPAILAKTSSRGVPFYAIGVTISISLIPFLGKVVGEGVVFQWLVNLVGLSIIIVWLLINVTHIRFRKAYISQGYKIADLPYKALFYPFGAYLGI